jgi:hypothetical protein
MESRYRKHFFQCLLKNLISNDVEIRLSAPLTADGIGECLSVAGTPSDIRKEDYVSLSSEKQGIVDNFNGKFIVPGVLGSTSDK